MLPKAMESSTIKAVFAGFSVNISIGAELTSSTGLLGGRIMTLYLNRSFNAAALILFVTLLTSTTAFASTRLYVSPNGSIAHIHGRLSGYSSNAQFILFTRRGQQLNVQTSQGGATVVTIVYSNGKLDGSPGGIAVTVPQTGDVHIIVTEHKMAEPWNGPFTLDVKLK